MSDRSIYLGSANDPQPVFRADRPDAYDWPEGAVMAVTFTREDFPTLAEDALAELPRSVFFDHKGWPNELPSHRRLHDELRRELQTFPCRWNLWWETRWEHLAHDPHLLAWRRASSEITREMLSLLP